MENPMSWSATHNLIAKALHAEKELRSQAIIEVLREHKLLKSEPADLVVHLDAKLAEIDAQFARRLCGQSARGQIHDLLTTLGVI